MTMGFELLVFFAVDIELAGNGYGLKKSIAKGVIRGKIRERMKEKDFNWYHTIHAQIMKHDRIYQT